MDKTEKIEKTLNSLNGTTRAKANPFLFEKIKAGMQDAGRRKSSDARVIFAAALAVIAAFMINVGVWTSYTNAVKQQTSGKQNITSFAKEYFNSNTTYNY
jgi:hypothetical protein